MSTENTEKKLLLTDLSFADLVALRNFFDDKTPGFNIAPGEITNEHKYCTQELDYVEKFIFKKYARVKADTIVKKA